MRRLCDAEIFVAPELALLPPLLVLLDATLRMLRAAHPALDLDRSPDESPRLRAAWAAAAQLRQTSAALRRYERAARRDLRRRAQPADEIPF